MKALQRLCCLLVYRQHTWSPLEYAGQVGELVYVQKRCGRCGRVIKFIDVLATLAVRMEQRSRSDA